MAGLCLFLFLIREHKDRIQMPREFVDDPEGDVADEEVGDGGFGYPALFFGAECNNVFQWTPFLLSGQSPCLSGIPLSNSLAITFSITVLNGVRLFRFTFPFRYFLSAEFTLFTVKSVLVDMLFRKDKSRLHTLVLAHSFQILLL